MINEKQPQYLGMEQAKANQIIAFIRCYDLFVDEAESYLENDMGVKTDAQPGAGGVFSPAEDSAIRRESLLDNIKIIDDAIATVPEEYRNVVWRWVKDNEKLYSIPGSDYAGERTWYSYKKKFIWEVEMRGRGKKGW